MTGTKTFNAKGEEILAGLPNFSGSDNYYRLGLRRDLMMTEGVRWLADSAGAHWLTDIVASYQSYPKVRREEFQVWTLYVRDGDKPLRYPFGLLKDVTKLLPAQFKAIVTMTDGNSNDPIISQRIHYTDFPFSPCQLWFENDVLMLPSER